MMALKRFGGGGLALGLAFVALMASTSEAQFPETDPDYDPNPRVALRLYYSHEKQDHFSAVTALDVQAARAEDYRFIRVQGYVLREDGPGLLPLELFYSPDRRDNVSATSAQGRRELEAAGFKFGWRQGYVYAEPRPETAPLVLCDNPDRRDSFLVVTDEDRRIAAENGYSEIRVLGYIPVR